AHGAAEGAWGAEETAEWSAEGIAPGVSADMALPSAQDWAESTFAAAGQESSWDA
ncbi:uncharacterized protein VTP21DRAFT_4876, partial [Calcarisporiella thermophila]|uniref:uncharacterized protein n=1 Tax=Calcarisporiella thermophila TaxID=911321 RepID=UPI0037431CCB